MRLYCYKSILSNCVAGITNKGSRARVRLRFAASILISNVYSMYYSVYYSLHFISALRLITRDERLAHCVTLIQLNVQFRFGKLPACLNCARTAESRIIHHARYKLQATICWRRVSQPEDLLSSLSWWKLIVRSLSSRFYVSSPSEWWLASR